MQTLLGSSQALTLAVVALLIGTAFLGGRYVEQYQTALLLGEKHIHLAHIANEAALDAISPTQAHPKPFLKVPFPEVKQGTQETVIDGVKRKFSTDPYSKAQWGWYEKVPDCGAKLNITVNKLPVTLDQVKSAVYSKDGPDVMTIRVNGTCGAFKGSNSFYLRKGRSDAAVWLEIMVQDAFYFTRQFFESKNVSRIIDLGANVGVSLVYWASQFPDAQVIGVEPELNNFGMAVFNAGHRENVFLERVAVTSRLGWSKGSHIGDGQDWAWSEQPADGIERTDSFKAVTVLHLLHKYGWDFVDILKVDVEGSEREMCKDILNGDSWINKIRCITIENHDRFFKDDKIPGSTLCAGALEKAGFNFLGQFQGDNIRVWCRDNALTPALRKSPSRSERRSRRIRS